MAALVIGLPCKLHAQVPRRIRKVHEALRGDLDRSDLIVHVPVKFLPARCLAHLVIELRHLGVALAHVEAALSRRVAAKAHPVHLFAQRRDAQAAPPRTGTRLPPCSTTSTNERWRSIQAGIRSADELSSRAPRANRCRSAAMRS